MTLRRFSTKAGQLVKKFCSHDPVELGIQAWGELADLEGGITMWVITTLAALCPHRPLHGLDDFEGSRFPRLTEAEL